jgi:hypothetical protein
MAASSGPLDGACAICHGTNNLHIKRLTVSDRHATSHKEWAKHAAFDLSLLLPGWRVLLWLAVSQEPPKGTVLCIVSPKNWTGLRL